MEKKGLALIYDPHNLLQFVWYYCAEGKGKKWDALCLPNGYKGEYMSGFCEKASIFDKIYKSDDEFINQGILKKATLFLKMLMYAIMHKQHVLCRKIVGNYVNLDDYDELVVLTDSGIVSGACMALGKEKKVVILEDGTGDYFKRTTYFQKDGKVNIFQVQGYLLAKLGYSCPGHKYILKTSNDCIKYCSNIEAMTFHGYKSMEQLFDMTKVDKEEYEDILNRIYEQINGMPFETVDAVVFTDRMTDFSEKPEKYIHKFEEYINSNYKRILLKRHPRDDTNYHFADNVEVIEVSQEVPAEVLLPYIENKDIIFMYLSSVIWYIRPYRYPISYVYFEGFYEEGKTQNTEGQYMSEEMMMEKLKKLGPDSCNQIRL